MEHRPQHASDDSRAAGRAIATAARPRILPSNAPAASISKSSRLQDPLRLPSTLQVERPAQIPRAAGGQAQRDGNLIAFRGDDGGGQGFAPDFLFQPGQACRDFHVRFGRKSQRAQQTARRLGGSFVQTAPNVPIAGLDPRCVGKPA